MLVEVGTGVAVGRGSEGTVAAGRDTTAAVAVVTGVAVSSVVE